MQLLEPLTGTNIKLSDFKDAPATVIMFICNHCPFVKHLKGMQGVFGAVSSTCFGFQVLNALM